MKMMVIVVEALKVLALIWRLLASHQRCVFVLLVGMVTTVQWVCYGKEIFTAVLTLR